MENVNTYKVEFSYLSGGVRKRHTDIFISDSAEDAVWQCWRCYGAETNYMTERVWIERPATWDAVSFVDGFADMIERRENRI